MSDKNKDELIAEYIGQTFPFIMQEALEEQEARIEVAQNARVDAQILAKEHGILNKMLSESFKESLIRAYTEGLEAFSTDDLKLALALRSFERKSEDLSRKVIAEFQKLLSQ